MKALWVRVKAFFKGETNRDLGITTKANADCLGEVLSTDRETGYVYVNKSYQDPGQAGKAGSVSNTENDLANTSAHEIGHTLGLDHPKNENGEDMDDGSVMGTGERRKIGDVKQREFSDADKKKIREAVK